MKVLTRFTILAVTLVLAACNSDSSSSSDDDSESSSGNGSGGASAGVEAGWAMTVTDASRDTEFEGVAVGPDGSVYAVGAQETETEVDYGSGVSVEGGNSSENAVIVKYNEDGEPQWAQTAEVAPSRSRFLAVAVDDDGNVFAAGYQRGTGEYDYGNGVTAQSEVGTDTPGNLVLVKYNADGVAQWARTAFSREGGEFFTQTSEVNGLAVDGDGNVYAAGRMGVGTYTLSKDGDAELTVSGSGDPVSVVVKYDADGTAQWASSVKGASGQANSRFYDVAVSSDGDVYVVGQQRGSFEYRYRSRDFAEQIEAVAVTGPSGRNAVLVRYDSDGDAQWARSVETGGQSEFFAVAVDDSGNVLVAGYQRGDDEFTYGGDANTTGGLENGSNAVVVSYSSDGDALWAQAAESAEDESEFHGVAVDSSGGVIAVGYLKGSGSFGFGNDIEVDGSSDDENALLVSFDDEGVAQQARTVSGVDFPSEFNGVAANDNVYVVGFQEGSESFEYGDDVTATGKVGIDNAVIVKY